MTSYDLAIVGGGPGGYVASIRASQLGMKVCLVDENSRLGGTCLRVGCIPSKALLESSRLYARLGQEALEHGIIIAPPKMDLEGMLKRKDSVVETLTSGISGLLKKNKIDVLKSRAKLQKAGGLDLDGKTGYTRVEAKNIVLATGSRPISLPHLPFDGEKVISSTEALSMSSIPERFLVVGGGAIGLELGQVWARLGAQVTIVEMLTQIAPFADKLVARLLMRSLKEDGLDIKLETKLENAIREPAGVRVKFLGPKGEFEESTFDRVLVAVGRSPASLGLGLEENGVETDAKGFVKVDARFETSCKGIYAIGDLIGPPMLAHKAEEEGIAVAEILAGEPGQVNYNVIPSVIYTHPELSQVGKTEEQCRQEGISIKKGQFYFQANGRALAANDAVGVVKIIVEAETDRILGVHIVGPQASELIGEAVVAMELGASAKDLARTPHAHPTLSEAIREAALSVERRSIHA